MEKRKLILVVVLSIITLSLFVIYSSCVTLTETDDSFEERDNYIVLDEIEDLSTITLKKKAFTIQFQLQPYNSDQKLFYSLRATGSTDSSIFDHIKVNQALNDVPFFGPGTGMAPSATGKYESLILNPNANHYIIYDPANVKDQRADSIGAGDGILNLTWTIENVIFDRNVYPVEQMDIDTIYLCILIDSNINKVIDENEYKRIKLIFK